MGLFDFFKKKSEVKNTEKKENIPVKIDLSKQELVKKINLSKEQVKISLEKKNVDKLIAEVQLAVDVSGSMYYNFEKGLVQETLNRLIPISLNFDDDGIVPVYAFDEEVTEVEELTMDNLLDYSRKNLNRLVGGGTCYAPTLKSILNKAKKGKLKFPVFLLFITDGDNYDKQETKDILKELSNYDIYVQFIGIGYDDFSFLKTLDNLKGRKFDNAGFIQFSDFSRFSVLDVYDELLKEFVDIYKKNTFKSGKISLKK